MASNPKDRRKFLKAAAAGAAGLGITAAAGCDPGTYFDYLTSDDVDRVNDRFHESMAGHVKALNLPSSTSNEAVFLWTSDIHITIGKDHYMEKLGYYANKAGAEFVLHSGDCVNDGNRDELQKWLRVMEKHLPVPMITAIGNHDLYGDGWDEYKRHIGPAAYRFEYGPCDFIFTDTAGGTMGYDQLDWVEKVLKRNKSVPARFVLGHYPIYEGKLQTPAAMGDVNERMMLFDLFDDCNVDYHLSGHKHTGANHEIRGVRYIIAGTGSSYKQILDDDYHFYRFRVRGGKIDKKKIYFDDVEMS